VPPINALRPRWETTDRQTVRYYRGDVFQILPRLPPQSVQCIVTSPPYWGLRDYGTGTWEGGDPVCDHDQRRRESDGSLQARTNVGSPRDSLAGRALCRKCGATRVTSEIGQERTPEEYVQKMVALGRLLWRVLRDDGTLWLNLGDTYGAGKCGGGNVFSGGRTDGRDTRGGSVKFVEGAGDVDPARAYLRERNLDRGEEGGGGGGLVGIPWRVALALQADGWALRMDHIWHKPSPMPESATNRCTKAHEYLFLLTKRGGGYYYDREAIVEPFADDRMGYAGRYTRRKIPARPGGNLQTHERLSLDGRGKEASPSEDATGSNKRSVWSVDDETALASWMAENAPHLLAQFLEEGRNKPSVWTVAPGPYKGAHFAVFPTKLVEPCILAGTSARGACPACGAPWRRVVEVRKLRRERKNRHVKRTGQAGTGNVCDNTVAGVSTRTLGWQPGCKCYGVDLMPRAPAAPGRRSGEGEDAWWARLEREWRPLAEEWRRLWDVRSGAYKSLTARPCVVLDPFVGSGTTALVAVGLGRACWGVDLSREYLDRHAVPRVSGNLLSRPSTADLVP
jgi:DNA modification methylase